MPDPFTAPAALSSDRPFVVGVQGSSREPRRTAPHSHPRGQLLGTLEGLSTIGTQKGQWVVPPTHAIWLPPRHRHAFASHGAFNGWSVYVAEAACGPLPGSPRVLRVSGLLREAAIRAASWRKDELAPPEIRIAQVILDEIASSPEEPFGLPMPRDPRLIRVAEMILAAPEEWKSLEASAARAGMAARTLTRRFPLDTGFTFRAWQQRARLAKAMEWLAEGRSVTTVAFDLGYETVGSFIDLFKAGFGMTPGQYFLSPPT